MTAERVETIRERLQAAFEPVSLEIEDDSAAHAGHVGAQSGGGHFNVSITSAAFAGKTPIQRHRMVYDALGTMMDHDIHALSIKANTP